MSDNTDRLSEDIKQSLDKMRPSQTFLSFREVRSDKSAYELRVRALDGESEGHGVVIEITCEDQSLEFCLDEEQAVLLQEWVNKGLPTKKTMNLSMSYSDD